MKMLKILRFVWNVLVFIMLCGLCVFEIWELISCFIDGTATVKHVCCILLVLAIFGGMIYYGYIHKDKDETEPADKVANEMFDGTSKGLLVTTMVVNSFLVALVSFFFDWLSDSTIKSFWHYLLLGIGVVVVLHTIYGAYYLYKKNKK